MHNSKTRRWRRAQSLRLIRVWKDKRYRRKQVESHKGIRHSATSRKKLSKTWKRIGHPRGMLGRKHSVATKRKMSSAHVGHFVSEITKRRLSRTHLKNPSFGMLGKHHSSLSKRRISLANRGKRRSSAQRAVQSERQKLMYRSPKARQRLVAAMQRGRDTPNKAERRLARLLKKHFHSNFRLNVGASVVIGGKVPDFVNVNGRKSVVELFGDYWHSAYCGKSKRTAESERKRHFSKWGFSCAIIWESELPDEVKVIKKVSEVV
jgi:G:T-mismatch repair DNA endonuclease (very short patch repair protein)